MRLRRGTARNTRHAVGIFALSLAAILIATQADARSRRHHARASSSQSDDGWREGHASIVVDAKTGKVLQESNADKLRHPASLTKIMTLYLLFEQIDAGRIKLDSRITVSEHASEAAPTKLGLDAGQKIEVEDAIKAVVTRSANDMAIAIGETIAGSEEAFAARMTKKAHALGMNNTVFTNASGLPDKRQVTTARDLSILGRAIQDRFPNLYRFFSIRTFVWHGSPIGNHNRLLGSVEGVDGIKTGYTRASGFNLVTSVKRNNRYIVAVVLGGRSSGARDAHMRELISDYMPRAYAGARTAPMIAEALEPKAPKFVAKLSTRAPMPRPAPVEGSREPIRPLPVRTVQLSKNSEQQFADIPNSGTLGTLTISPFGDVNAGPPQSLQVTAYSDARGMGTPAAFAAIDKPKHVEAAPAPAAEPVQTAEPAPDTKPRAVKVATATLSSLQLTTPAEAAPARSAVVEEPAAQKPVLHAAIARPIPAGWQIQIGAFTGEPEAQTKLQAARSRLGGMLAKATSFTEKTFKGSAEYVRARFAGFHSEADAKKACDALKRNDFECITVRN